MNTVEQGASKQVSDIKWLRQIGEEVACSHMRSSTTKPTYSIILPTHNRARMLCRAISSVLRQTYSDYELIVVDDASIDDTGDVIAAYHDPRLHYIRLHHNSGASAARNTGIRAANGVFIVFLDDDDEFFPDFLTKMNVALQNAPADVGFAWCGARRVRLTRSGLQTVRVQSWEQFAKEAKGRKSASFDYLGVATSFGLTVRRTCFEKVGLFDEDLQAVVDTDLMFRLGTECTYTVVPEVLVTIYLHEGDQLTDKNVRRADAFARLIQNNIVVIVQHDYLWIRYHHGAAALYYFAGNRPKGRDYFLRVLCRKPFRWRTWKSIACYELFGREDLGLRNMARRSLPCPSLSTGESND